MMLTQCIGFVNFSLRCVAQIAHIMEPFDTPLALVVDDVAPALNERVFAPGTTQISQVMVPFDAQLALVIDHVAPALDERIFAPLAQIMVPFDALFALVVDDVAFLSMSVSLCKLPFHTLRAPLKPAPDA